MTAIPAPRSTRARGVLTWISNLRAWLFLIFLLIFFEVWAETIYGSSFVANLYNWQSITVFATAPLLLALGQTLVIISSGIDLSVGFTMGLSAVVAAHISNICIDYARLPPAAAAFLAILAGIGVSLVPG
ncbi:MAG TPA: ribose ABC transporter, partial [Roseiarcus sp.]|nr:ribose ABC transporter [Roseiarcus sp.]